MVLFNCTGLLLAQDNKAIISGIVTDETKMGVIGAAVQIKNESTGFRPDQSLTKTVNTPSSSCLLAVLTASLFHTSVTVTRKEQDIH